jgi:anti-sigma-K factor RskA
MKIYNDALREKLAAEYVLGSLSARARRRFTVMLRENPPLRHAVARWEERLTPLAASLPGIEPPARVWKQIEARLHPRRDRATGFWQNLAFWRFSSFASGLLALALLVMVFAPVDQGPAVPDPMMVVVMDDLQTRRPAMTVSWEPNTPGKRVMRLRVIGHAEMGPGTAWELWMLPGGDARPVSLGLITTHETQTVVVPEPLASALDQAEGLAMSVEPEGGSPTGLPTGPVLYAGQCIKT